MEVYVNYPVDDEGKKELRVAIAQFHATLVVKAVDDLNLDRLSKKKVMKELLNNAKNEAKNESKLLKGTSAVKH